MARPATKRDTIKADAERIPTAQLLEWRATYNPRRISDDDYASLCLSLKTYGHVQVVVLNRRSAARGWPPRSAPAVVGGHQTVRAAAEVGIEELAVRWVDLDAADEKALNLALNRISGAWVDEALAGILREVTAAHGDGKRTGFSTAEIDELLAGARQALDGDPAEPSYPPEAPALAKPGDLWSLGPHRLVCGDSSDPAVLERALGGLKPDLLLTDPPYGINAVKPTKAGRGSIGGPRLLGTTEDGKMVASSPRGNTGGGGPLGFGRKSGTRGRSTNDTGRGKNGCDGLVPAKLHRVIEGDDRPFDPRPLLGLARNAIIFGGNYFAHLLPASACWLVWDKGVAAESYFADVELAWSSFPTPATMYRFRWAGLVRAGSRREELAERVHPTQKPVGLMTRLIADYSKHGEVVIDPYLGSAPVLIACEKLGRVCVGIEKEPAYIDIALQRWQDYTRRTAVRAEPG